MAQVTMQSLGYVLSVILMLWTVAVTSSSLWPQQKLPKTSSVCRVGKQSCSVKDQVSFDAISALHQQIDDDHDGDVDLKESDGFLRDELQYTDDYERHNKFHGKDTKVSVSELWKIWQTSEVHNWTVEDTVGWLVENVELPQYSEIFQTHLIDGAALPRLAANSQFISGVLGVKNPVHKQKLTLKAMDVVLFGSPKRAHSYLKDLILVTSLAIAAGGCWFAYVQNQNSKTHLRKMMKDLDILQKAEDSLSELQTRLNNAQQEQKSVEEEKLALEKKMKGEIDESKREAQRLKEQREGVDQSERKYKLAEEELEHVRILLSQAEQQLEDHQWIPPPELQQWLQLTYEIELKHYNAKKVAAEKQLVVAKEGCDKIRKKRSAFMGSLRIAHSSSIDSIDVRIGEARYSDSRKSWWRKSLVKWEKFHRKRGSLIGSLRMVHSDSFDIVEHRIGTARTSLEEVRQDLQERLNRWRKIELLCGFPIINNPGMSVLEPALKESAAQSPTQSSNLTSQGSEVDLSFNNALVERYAHIWLAKANLHDHLHSRLPTINEPCYAASNSPMLQRAGYVNYLDPGSRPTTPIPRCTSPRSLSPARGSAPSFRRLNSGASLSSDGSRRSSAALLSDLVDTDEEFVPPSVSAAPGAKHHGKFYTLGLAAMYATSFRRRQQQKQGIRPRSQSLIPGSLTNNYSSPLGARISPGTPPYTVMPHPLSTSGLNALYHSQPEVSSARRLGAMRGQSEIWNQGQGHRASPPTLGQEIGPLKEVQDGAGCSTSELSSPDSGNVTFSLGASSPEEFVAEPKYPTAVNTPPKVKQSVSLEPSAGKVRPSTLAVSHSDPLMAFMGAQVTRQTPVTDRQSPAGDRTIPAQVRPTPVQNGKLIESKLVNKIASDVTDRTGSSDSVRSKSNSESPGRNSDDDYRSDGNASDTSLNTSDDKKRKSNRLNISVFSKKDKSRKA